MSIRKPVIDYTNKDYASLRRAMLELARYRLPEWTDQAPGDLGVLLVDLFAYMGDIILYYQDRIANETFLDTAVERRSVMHLLRLIGYELRPAVAAGADLTLTFKAPAAGQEQVTIPTGAQFVTQGKSLETFEYLGPPRVIDLGSSQVRATADGRRAYTGLPVRHSRAVTGEVLGSSSGEPGQRFKLARKPLIPESLKVEVDEGAGAVLWQRRQSLLYYIDDDGRVTLAGPESREYFIQLDENGDAWVVFGDGVYGRKPAVGTNNIHADYRVGGGIAGNVAAGAISKAVTAIPLLDSAVNPKQAAGGEEAESIEHGARFGPLAFRSGNRAVTISDFFSLAHQAGGVAKVRARTRGWNQVELFVAPVGGGAAPADLKRRLVAYFEDKRMVGTQILIRDPTYVEIDISVEVIVEHNFQPADVRHQAEAAIAALVAFYKADFGRPLYLSKVYEAIEAIAGVHAATVTRFARRSALSAHLPRLARLPVRAREPFDPASFKRAAELSGRIDIDEYEIPAPGQLEVTIKEVPP
jgi:uncharacterized phage protein gp47/JayE